MEPNDRGKQIVCPLNHANRFEYMGMVSTELAIPHVVDSFGNNVPSDPNIYTTEYRCLDCSNTFKTYRDAYGNSVAAPKPQKIRELGRG